MDTTTEPLRLDGASLGRTWWQLPLLMFAALIVLAYGVAALCRVPGWGGIWPLVIAGAIGLCGMLNGFSHNLKVWAMLGQRAGVAYLPADHTLTQRVHALAARAGVPPPRVGVMNQFNAYASGPNPKHAVVVLGVPLIRRLTGVELDAVIGHELGHIATGDMRRMQYGSGFQSLFSGSLGVFGEAMTAGTAKSRGSQWDMSSAGTVARVVSWLGRHLVGFFGELALKASSRNREYHADAIGAALSSPAAMAGALEKVHKVDAPASPAEQDFAYLMFRGFGGRLFATHPTLLQRLAALQDGGYIRRLPVLPERHRSTIPEAA